MDIYTFVHTHAQINIYEYLLKYVIFVGVSVFILVDVIQVC